MFAPRARIACRTLDCTGYGLQQRGSRGTWAGLWSEQDHVGGDLGPLDIREHDAHPLIGKDHIVARLREPGQRLGGTGIAETVQVDPVPPLQIGNRMGARIGAVEHERIRRMLR